MAIIEEVVAVLETVAGVPPEPPEISREPFVGAGNRTARTTEVTLDVSLDDPAVIKELQEALAEIPGVQRVRLSDAGDRSARLTVTLEASPTPTESLLTFKDALAETDGIGRVLLTEFVDDHATLVVTAVSAGLDVIATEAPSVVCAWCGRMLTVGGSMVSHGICPACAAETAARASGAGSSRAPSASSDTVVYLQRSPDVWLERRYERDGTWVTNPTSYSAALPAQTVFDGVSARYPDRLVVLAGQAEPVAEIADSPVSLGSDAVDSPSPALPEPMRGRRPRGQAHLSLKRLRQTLNMAVPVDPELLLEALTSIQTIVDGVARAEDLRPKVVLELGRGLDQLQETIDSINRMAAISTIGQNRRHGPRGRSHVQPPG